MKIKISDGSIVELDSVLESGQDFVAYKSKNNPDEAIAAYFQQNPRIKIGKRVPSLENVFADSVGGSVHIDSKTGKIFYNIVRYYYEVPFTSIEKDLIETTDGELGKSYIIESTNFQQEVSDNLISKKNWYVFSKNAKILTWNTYSQTSGTNRESTIVV